MLRALIIAPFLVFTTVQIAFADLSNTILAMRNEVAAREAALGARFGPNTVEQTLIAAFDRGSVGWASGQYASSWSGWIYLDWDSVDDFYWTADQTLRAWAANWPQTGLEEAEVQALLDTGMAAFRRMDSEITHVFDLRLELTVQSGRIADRARAASLANQRDLYDYYRALGETVYANWPYRPIRSYGDVHVFPPFPAEGQPVTDMSAWAVARAEEFAQAAIASGDLNDARRAIQEGRAALAYYQGPDADEIRSILTYMEDRVRYGQQPLDVVFDQLRDLPDGPLRDALLNEAQDGIMDRMGHLISLMGAGAQTEEERRVTLTDALGLAQQLVMLRDDLNDPISMPSGALRAVNGLRTFTALMDIARDGDADAQQVVSMVNDLAGTSGTIVSPTAPFAIPAAMVSAELQQVKEAWGHGSDAMAGVRDAIAGDPSGVARAEAAGRRLQAALDPRTIGRAMSVEGLKASVANIPIVRSIVGFFTG